MVVAGGAGGEFWLGFDRGCADGLTTRHPVVSLVWFRRTVGQRNVLRGGEGREGTLEVGYWRGLVDGWS